MNTSKSPSPLNKQIYEEACEWLIAFRTGPVGTDSKKQLDAWLRRSPEHVRAYLEVSAIWEDTALHDPNRLASSEMHIARARAVPDDNVISVPFPRQQPVTGIARRRAGFAIALAAALLLAAIGIGFALQRGVYATDIGEQRSLTLQDGSVIDLNARSRIRVRYTSGSRRIDLIEGQALFHVAKDRARPFIVASGSTQVRAVGTQFDVNRKSAGIVVTVVEGRVAVLAPSAPPSEADTLVAAGEQLRVTDTSARKTEHPDVSAATAWRQHRLVFNSAALSDVVEEFNRYNARQLVVDTPELESFGVVGVFSSTDPGVLLRFLNAQPGIRIEERGDRIHIIAAPR
jgi:transmembrane sensor